MTQKITQKVTMKNTNWFGNKKVKPIFTPVKLPTKKSVRKIPKKNLTWPQAVKRYPKVKMFGDADRDGKLNMFDCKPFDKKKHGYLLRKDIRQRIKITDSHPRTTWANKGYAKKWEKSLIDSNKQNSKKNITKKDIVRFYEKNPDMIKVAERLDNPISARQITSGAAGQFSYKGKEKTEIEISNRLPLKEDIPNILKHEHGHQLQLEEGDMEELKEITETHRKRLDSMGKGYPHQDEFIEKDANRRIELERKKDRDEAPENIPDIEDYYDGGDYEKY